MPAPAAGADDPGLHSGGLGIGQYDDHRRPALEAGEVHGDRHHPPAAGQLVDAGLQLARPLQSGQRGVDRGRELR